MYIVVLIKIKKKYFFNVWDYLMFGMYQKISVFVFVLLSIISTGLCFKYNKI